jgi:hypothetical protein
MERDVTAEASTTIAEYVEWLCAVRGVPIGSKMTHELWALMTPAEVSEYQRLSVILERGGQFAALIDNPLPGAEAGTASLPHHGSVEP